MSGSRVALVSGGTRGIGRAISLELAAAGFDVAVNYRRDEVSAQSAVAELERCGARALAVRADLATPAGARELVARTVEGLGPVGVLVHNAGRASRGQYVVDTDPDEPAQLMRVHAFAAYWLAQLVVPGMRAAGYGHIVFVSSAATMRLRAGGSSYTMAKAAVEALAQTLDREEARHGIRVNVVAPGLTDTEMGRRTALARGTTIEEMGRRQAFGRVCRPDDIAKLVRFLTSADADFITGQRIYLHGGVYQEQHDLAMNARTGRESLTTLE